MEKDAEQNTNGGFTQQQTGRENELEQRLLGQYFRDIISGKHIDKYPVRELFLQAIGRGNQSCEKAKDAFTILKHKGSGQDVPLSMYFFLYLLLLFQIVINVLLLVVRIYVHFFEQTDYCFIFSINPFLRSGT